MVNVVRSYIRKFNNEHREKRRMMGLLTVLALAVTAAVTWRLHDTGFTLTNETFCGLEEHQHDESCYETVLVCGLEESEDSDGHTHTDACYEEQLVCGLEEHVHTVACLSDETADVETADDWEPTLPALTGDTAADVVSVAQSQMGYTESTANFRLADNGVTVKGYTRYGAWYGSAYGDWDAMFAAFCLHYAGVSAEDFPVNSGAYAWTVQLQDEGLYADAAEYVPLAGDLVFFDTDDDGRADRVGIIESVEKEADGDEMDTESVTLLRVIEGDRETATDDENESGGADAVVRLEYCMNPAEDDHGAVLGYGRVNSEGNDGIGESEEEDADESVDGFDSLSGQSEQETETTSAADSSVTYTAVESGMTVTVTAPEGALPENAQLAVIVFEEDSEEYVLAGGVIGLKTEENALDMIALDISFYDRDGAEIEPAEAVTVSIDLSGVLPEDADAGTIAVQHLTETDGGLKPVLVADASEDTEGTVDTETVTAEFTVKSFSTFTIQWSANTNDSTAISTTAYFSSDGGTTYETDDDLDPVSGTLWIGYDNEVDFDDGNSLLAVEGYTLDSAVLYVPNNQGTYKSYTISGIRATYDWSAGTWTYEYLAAGSDTWTTFSASVSVTTGGGGGGGPGGGGPGQQQTTNTYTAYLELYYVKDEEEVTGELYITDDIENTGSLVATYDGDEDVSEGYYYRWYKLNTDTGEYEEIEGEIEQSIEVYIDGARQTYRVELVRTSDNAVVATSEHYQVPYYDQLQNGSFEAPEVSGSAQLTNGLYDELVWQTTGFGSYNTNRAADGQDIEIVNASAAGSSYGETKAADGDQYAELNCEAAGTLYQDVLTIPEVPLYWQASHEGRSGDDTMCVIIVDAGFADKYITTQDDVNAVIEAARTAGLTDPSTNESTEITYTYTDVESGESASVTIWLITSDSDGWHEYSGTYTVPEGQYVTRFMFSAVSTSTNDLTAGNLLDDVSFSQTAPVSTKSGNVTITKTVDGLDDSTEIPAGTYTFTVYDSDRNSIGTVSLPTANATADQTQYWTYTLTGKTAGSYYAVESNVTFAPEGYAYTSTVGTVSNGSSFSGTQSTNFTVNNNSTTEVAYTNSYSGGAEMPETGGTGTLPYTMAGLLLMGGAALLLYKNKRYGRGRGLLK